MDGTVWVSRSRRSWRSKKKGGDRLAEVRFTSRDRPGDVLRVIPARLGLHANGSCSDASFRGLHQPAGAGRVEVDQEQAEGNQRAMENIVMHNLLR